MSVARTARGVQGGGQEDGNALTVRGPGEGQGEDRARGRVSTLPCGGARAHRVREARSSRLQKEVAPLPC